MAWIWRKLWSDERGAVAPIVALSLFVLLAAGAISFDYARVAGLHTELQNAADHAALAAATQLDGNTGARARATAAARNFIENLTVMANDRAGAAITIPTDSIIFYQSYDDSTGAVGAVATTDDTAHIVAITVDTRTVKYALTPIVAARVGSGPITASAMAGLGSAICNSPPVMLCNPLEPDGNIDKYYAFNAADYKGYGMRLLTGASEDTPGNFGYLDTGYGSSPEDLANAIAGTQCRAHAEPRLM